MPSGTFVYAASATSWIVTDLPGVPFTENLPLASSMSSSDASSRWAAIFLALSASLRATIAVAAPGPGLLLLGPQLVVAHLVEGLAQRGGVVAGVVHEARRRRVRELLGLNEVLHAEVGRVHADLVRRGLHQPLDHVRGLGDAERA